MASSSSSGSGTGTAGTGAIAIDVEFTLITPDKLRKIEFGLTKTVQGTDILWTITFELYERTSATATFPTDADISLSVKVDPALNDGAEKASSGLTPAQEAQATGPAAVAAKAAKTNPVLQPVADLEIQKAVQ
jgi:hypothetical protein